MNGCPLLPISAERPDARCPGRRAAARTATATAPFHSRLQTKGAAIGSQNRATACIAAAVDPITNTSVDLISLIIVVLYVFAVGDDLTPAK